MNGKDSACFSKKSDEWETPKWLFDLLNDEFQFVLDAAANGENRKCNAFYDKYLSALDHDWAESTYVNPPYSKIGPFMKKAYEESQKGATVVCLIPVRSDTRYWHDYVMKSQEIRFIKGRLKFGDSKTGAPFPSCIVIFKPPSGLIPRAYPWIGKTINTGIKNISSNKNKDDVK